MKCIPVVDEQPDASGRYTFRCPVCNQSFTHRRKDAKVSRQCGEQSPPPGFGPGTELTPMLHDELGVSEEGCKLCERVARQMDRLGVKGVRQLRQRFAEHLKRAADKKGWGVKLLATLASLKSGLALRIKPWDIYGSLIDEACRRAEAR